MIKRVLPLLLLLHVGAAHGAWYENWSAKPAWPEPISFFSGAGLTLASLPIRDHIQNQHRRDRPLGRWSKGGDVLGQLIPNLAYTGGMITAAYFGEAFAGEHAQLMIATTAEAVLITTVIKYAVREERPDSNHRNSFPSGHSTSAFAFASVVGVEHGWKWGVPAYMLAGFVAWSRINDNAHYLHDTIAGATIGLSTGLGIYYARERRREGVTAMILPMPLEEGAGLSYVRAF